MGGLAGGGEPGGRAAGEVAPVQQRWQGGGSAGSARSGVEEGELSRGSAFPFHPTPLPPTPQDGAVSPRVLFFLEASWPIIAL